MTRTRSSELRATGYGDRGAPDEEEHGQDDYTGRFIVSPSTPNYLAEGAEGGTDFRKYRRIMRTLGVGSARRPDRRRHIHVLIACITLLQTILTTARHAYQDDNQYDYQQERHIADASERVPEVGQIWPQTVTDRVADPDRVRYEEHRPEQVPEQERAEWNLHCPGQWPSQKPKPADKSRDADRESTIPADERLRHHHSCG